MPRQKRFKTNYPGVYYVEGKAAGRTGIERIYYIRYKRNGKTVEEKAGRQHQNDMTPARASGIRAQRIEGKKQSNTAQRKADKLAKEAKAGRWTIQKLSDEYFSHRVDNKSTRTDKGRYKNYLEKPFGKREPKQIIRLDIDRLRVKLLKTKSTQTVKHVLALLKRIITFGADRELCTGLGFKIIMPVVDNIKIEDLTTEQLQSLFTVLDETPHQTAANMMRLALFTGLRRGEIFKLRWDDIDFQRSLIHIRNPKGGKSQTIPLNSSARELFNSIQGEEGFIFPGRGGGLRKDINKDLSTIKKKAGLPDEFRALHGLRHVFATMLACSGRVDMIALQRLLTHKDQRMTQRYMHYREDALAIAAEQVGPILNDALSQGKKKLKAI